MSLAGTVPWYHSFSSKSAMEPSDPSTMGSNTMLAAPSASSTTENAKESQSIVKASEAATTTEPDHVDGGSPASTASKPAEGTQDETQAVARASTEANKPKKPPGPDDKTSLTAKKAAMSPTIGAKRARSSARETLSKTFRDGVLQAVLDEYYVDSEGKAMDVVAVDDLFQATKLAAASARHLAKENIMKTWMGPNLEGQIDAVFSRNGQMKGGVSQLTKLLVSLTPKNNFNHKIRNARARTAELLYGIAKAENPVLGEIVGRTELNTLDTWLDDFMTSSMWKYTNQLLIFLDALPMTKEHLLVNKDIARRVNELRKLSSKKAKNAPVTSSEELTRIANRATKLTQKWVGNLRSKQEKSAPKTDRIEKTAATEPAKALPRADAKPEPGLESPTVKAEADEKVDIPAAGNIETPEAKRSTPSPDVVRKRQKAGELSQLDLQPPKRAKALSDDDLFGSPPVPKRRMNEVKTPKPKPVAPTAPTKPPSKLSEEKPASRKDPSAAAVPSGDTPKGEGKPAARVEAPRAEGKIAPPPKPRKRVTWAPGEKLNNYEYIETRQELMRIFSHEPPPSTPTDVPLTEEGDENPRDDGVQAQLHDMDVERHRLQKVAMWKRLDSMREELTWHLPLKVDLGREEASAEYQGVEAPMRAAMVSLTPEVFPNEKRDSSPVEAPFTSYPSEEPIVIPLEADIPAADSETAAVKTSRAEDHSAPKELEDQLRSMGAEMQWSSPQKVALSVNSTSYVGTEYDQMTRAVRDVSEVFPEPSTSSPGEAPPEQPPSDANARAIPLDDKQNQQQTDQETNQAVALASLLRSAMDPGAATQDGPLGNGSLGPGAGGGPPMLPMMVNGYGGLQELLQHMIAQPQAAASEAHNTSSGPVVPEPHVANFPPPVDFSNPSNVPPPFGLGFPPPPPHAGNTLNQQVGAGAAAPATDRKSGKGQKRKNGNQGGSQVCRFYNTPRGCNNGDSCRFVHGEH